jgi:hypothetical protein
MPLLSKIKASYTWPPKGQRTSAVWIVIPNAKTGILVINMGEDQNTPDQEDLLTVQKKLSAKRVTVHVC